MDDRSIKIGHNYASPLITGSVGGDVKNEVKNSFNTTKQDFAAIAEIAAEIQSLLEQLEKFYSTETTTGKMKIATEAIECIDRDPNLAKPILSALKAGDISSLQQLLNHPAASFTIAALQDWQKK